MGWNLHPKLGWRLGDLREAAKAGDEYAIAQRFSLMIQPTKCSTDVREDCYRYVFKPGPQQKHDPVIYVVRQAIRELNHDYCEFANVGVRVWSTTEDPPIWPREGLPAEYCIKLYTFTQEWQEFPLTVPVTIVPAFGPLSEDTVYVRFGIWTPLKDWLLTIPDSSALPERTPFEETRVWWKRNGRRFRLMDLPKELRAIIFEYVLGPDVYPLSKVPLDRQDNFVARQNAHIIFGFGYSHWVLKDPPFSEYFSRQHIEEERPVVSRPSLSILRVSKQVHQEALKAGWQGTKKNFVNGHIFTLVADSCVGPAVQFNCLAQVRLDFSNVEWFDFFGVQADYESGLSLDVSRSKGEYLKRNKLPNLCYLEMRFRNPEDGFRGSPWAANVSYGECLENPHECCQRTVVGMICTFAYPFVSHIATVKIMGFVKRDTKSKWEAIYANELCHDQEAAIQDIFKTPLELLPPPCVCERSCGQKLATRWCPYTKYTRLCSEGWESRSWEGGNHFDFEDDDRDNDVLNAMCGYGGYVPGATTRTWGRLCECGCGKLADRVRIRD